MASKGWKTVFRTDLREVLRDRRTLFINLLLPVLLYPLMTLLLVQVSQIAAATPRPPPRIALVGADGDLQRALTGLTLVALSPSEAKAATDPDRAAARDILRRHDLVAVLSVEGNRLEIRRDEAHARIDRAEEAINKAVGQWKRQRSEQALVGSGLNPADVLDPVTIIRSGVAPPVETIRTRLAGIIPLLLVVLAVSGAMYPAVDLLAGERERGTLETLLSLPVRRRDLFLGKLLVVLVAALAAVLCNLMSLGVTATLVGSQVAAGGLEGFDARTLAGVGLPTLGLCLLLLLPLVITIGAVALALSAVATSAKEAQNHLAPLLLVVALLGSAAAIPDLRPNPALDLIPVTGATVVLRAALENPGRVPWGDAFLVLVASVCTAAVIVGWAVRLLEREDIRFPGLVRAGWGRWRTWGVNPGPGGLEALGLVAVAAAGMTLGAGLFAQAAPATLVVAPLLLFIAGPALLHAWAGAYRPAQLYWILPTWRQAGLAVLLSPLAIAVTLSVGVTQQLVVDPVLLKPVEEQMRKILGDLSTMGGLPLLLLCTAIVPAVCEELLCRGPILAGLRRALGPTTAVIVSALLFAALHQSPFRFVPQAVLGILLAILTLRTGSVMPAMIVHALHNGSLVVAETVLR